MYEIWGPLQIFTIARNHLISHIKKQKRDVGLEDIENTLWERVDWGAKMSLNYDEQRLLEAISQLSPEDATLLHFKYLEGWSYEDIAKETGKNSGALRTQAHRALKELKTILKQK